MGEIGLYASGVKGNRKRRASLSNFTGRSQPGRKVLRCTEKDVQIDICLRGHVTDFRRAGAPL